ECIDDVPPRFADGRQGYNRFRQQYGDAWDPNCEIDESSFRFVSETITEEECTKTITVRRQYRIRDLCGNQSSPFLERIEVEDKTPPTITCPDDFTAEGTLDDLESLTGLVYSGEEKGIPLTDAWAQALKISYSDNCDVISLTYQDVAQGSCPTTI